MSAAELGLDISAIDQRLAGGWSLPVQSYWEPAIHELETKAVFGRNWQIGAPRSKLMKPGDTALASAGQIPVVLVCGKDGAIRGFVNVCRHRGYPVVRKEGNLRTMACGYHGWTYALDGMLIAAPQSDAESGFEKCSLGLVPISVHVWGPIVFINPDPEARPFEEAHPGFLAMVRERDFNLDLDTWQVEKRVENHIKANWKLMYDNDRECYHCNHIHSTTFGDAFGTDNGEYNLRVFDKLATYNFKSSGRSSHKNLRSQYYKSFQIYPAGFFAQHDEIMFIHQIHPTGPETCFSWYEFYSLKGSDRERVSAWLDLWEKTVAEDAEAVALQHAALKSNMVPHSRYISPQEDPLKQAAQLIWSDCKAVILA